jgi:hypothetical protein
MHIYNSHSQFVLTSITHHNDADNKMPSSMIQIVCYHYLLIIYVHGHNQQQIGLTGMLIKYISKRLIFLKLEN